MAAPEKDGRHPVKPGPAGAEAHETIRRLCRRLGYVPSADRRGAVGTVFSANATPVGPRDAPLDDLARA